MTLSPAETEFAEILKEYGFKTSNLRASMTAPSIQREWGNFVIIPDILAIDEDGHGWCFEVKDEAASKPKMTPMEMPGGYRGVVWFLEPWKTRSYFEFSKAFDCPCVMAIGDKNGWRVGLFTRKKAGKVEYNKRIVVINWNDERGTPILFNVMDSVDQFLEAAKQTRTEYWE